MKQKITLFSIFTILSFSLFANDYSQDIYEDDGVYAKPSVQQPKSSTTTKSKSSIKTLSQDYKSHKEYQENSISKKKATIEGIVFTDFYYDNFLNKSDLINNRDKKINTYFNIDSYFRLKFSQGVYVETNWFLQPTSKRLYTGDYYAQNPNLTIGDSTNSDLYGKENYIRRTNNFWDYGLSVETLFLGYKNNTLSIGAGKITPNFGIAHNKLRYSGVYGTRMPQEYKLEEKLGLFISGYLPFVSFTFNSFFDDTTGLSDTMFIKRGKDKSIGGAGNTEKMNNFALSLDFDFNALDIHLSYRSQNTDKKINKDREQGYALGLEYNIELEQDITFLPMLEFVFIENFDGMPKRNMFYSTVFLPFIYENWNLIFSNTTKYDYEENYSNYVSNSSQISIGYKFDFGLIVNAARIWEKNVIKEDSFMSNPKDKWRNTFDSWVINLGYMYQF